MEMTLAYIGIGLLELIVIVRVLLRPNRDSASRIAWVVVIAVIPVAGMLAYLLLGETNIGRGRVARSSDVLATMPRMAPALPANKAHLRPELPRRYTPLFRLGESINGFPPIGGNSASLTADTNAGIDAMVADMDAAQDHVHLIN